MTPAERQREYRRRQNQGKRVLHVAADVVELAEVLIKAGYLHRSDEDDIDRLTAALERALESMEISE